GLGAGIVVAATAVAAVTVMPALLGMAGRRVLPRGARQTPRPAADADAPRAERTTPRPAAASTTRRGLPERWARGVAARPVISAVAGVAILLALAATLPGLQIRRPAASQ